MSITGLPLNRVGFLRGDHGFLNAAVKHPSTSFLLFNNLGPLVKDDSKLAFVNHKDVEPLIGKNPFRQSEKHLIAEYNSTVANPLLVMLGLDERQKNGMAYKTYSGAPYFALDVTPVGSIREQAQGVISAVESRGLQFFHGRSHMKFSPEEGNVIPFLHTAGRA
jgi:NAD+ diphosphatase